MEWVMISVVSNCCVSWLSFSTKWCYDFRILELRAKIAGAKAHCLALGESHARLVTNLCVAMQVPIWTNNFSARSARRNSYDGEMEFFVVVRETAKRTEESSYEHEQSKRMKA
jgi:hypothetical protein